MHTTWKEFKDYVDRKMDKLGLNEKFPIKEIMVKNMVNGDISRQPHLSIRIYEDGIIIKDE
jgi:hypothetical protein